MGARIQTAAGCRHAKGEAVSRRRISNDQVLPDGVWAEKPGDGRQIQPMALGAGRLPENVSYLFAGMSDFGDAIYLTLEPPVFVPGGGHVEVECAGDTAIVRVFDASGEPTETRLQCAIVERGEEIRVIQAGGYQV